MRHILEHVVAWLISRAIVIAVLAFAAMFGCFLAVLLIYGSGRSEAEDGHVG